MVASLAPDLIQVSQISSGWSGASVRQTCAPLSFHTPETAIALSPAGVRAPDNCPPAPKLIRAVNVLPPSISEDATTNPLPSSACISAAEYGFLSCPKAVPAIKIIDNAIPVI